MACASIVVQKRPFSHLGDEGQIDNLRHAKRCRAIALAATSPKKEHEAVHKSRLRLNQHSPFFCGSGDAQNMGYINGSASQIGSNSQERDVSDECAAKRRRTKSELNSNSPTSHVEHHSGNDDLHGKYSSRATHVEPSQALFTLEQVQSIVDAAVEQKEAELIAKYDKILLERLKDQFNIFSKYMEDSIHRKYSDSETQFSYMS
eukprot:m.78027 g.78027  ORF g.78027 m.78027 type:complete len:204 (+) comp16212_c0_seq1:182-793(+)